MSLTSPDGVGEGSVVSGGMPSLIFFIDEIGGGGGRNAFFPSHPYDPPSKAGLNLLLRRGRAFGLCCLFATRNPGNVDYKGLSNCQTWMVSRLQTKRDRDKIRQGMSLLPRFTSSLLMTNCEMFSQASF